MKNFPKKNGVRNVAAALRIGTDFGGGFLLWYLHLDILLPRAECQPERLFREALSGDFLWGVRKADFCATQ